MDIATGWLYTKIKTTHDVVTVVVGNETGCDVNVQFTQTFLITGSQGILTHS